MKKLLVVLVGLLCCTVGLSQDSYGLTDESTLTVNGTSTLHDWNVDANTIEGAIHIEGNVLKEVSFKVEVASIISPRGATMDKKTHNALKKEEHPTITFTAQEITLFEGDGQIPGKLLIAGVEKEVSVAASLTKVANGFKIVGNQKITLQEYGMEPPTAMFGSIIVGDDVTVNFDLVFAKE